MANVDPITTLAAWLRTVASVTAVVPTDRIFQHEFPDGTFTYMAKNAVLLAASGGPDDQAFLNLGRQRIDVRVYGTKLETARAVYGVVHQALKNMTRVLLGGALLHSVVQEGGPIGVREPGTGSPVVFASYLLLYAERT